MSPEEIVEEIRRAAERNGGKPLGERLFLAGSSISRSQLWAAGFSSYSDALLAAGFAKNERTVALDPEFVLSSLVRLIRKIGRFPTKGHIKAERARDNSFPSYEAFLTVSGGAFSNLPSVAHKHCEAKGITDVLGFLPSQTKPATTKPRAALSPSVVGYVYLVKHGESYKIGRSNDAARRRREISLLLPQELEHVHIIETDDPEGIEAYWHKRFAAKRLRGEWFSLAAEDISAFKRRRYQ